MTTLTKEYMMALAASLDEPLEHRIQEGNDGCAKDILVPSAPELVRKKREIRSKIFAEAIAKNEMVDQVAERYYKEQANKETEIKS